MTSRTQDHPRIGPGNRLAERQCAARTSRRWWPEDPARGAGRPCAAAAAAWSRVAPRFSRADTESTRSLRDAPASVHRERRPQIDRDHAADLDFVRQDADHRVRLAVERQGSPDDAAVRGEVLLPEPVTEHGDFRRARRVLAREKRAARHGLELPHRRHVRRGPKRGDAQRIARSGQRIAGLVERGHLLERGRPGAPVEKVRQRGPFALNAALRVHAVEPDDSRRITQGERPQQEQIREAEDDRVGADGQSKGQCHDGRVAGTLEQKPAARANVPKNLDHVHLQGT